MLRTVKLRQKKGFVIKKTSILTKHALSLLLKNNNMTTFIRCNILD